jgi:hypothetical protein
MYFPKSQIKPNLYTNGGKYILSTTKQDYIGYYYEVSTGQRFTGKTPQDGPNIPLIIPTPTFPTIPPTEIARPIYIETQDELSEGFYKPTLPSRVLPQSNPTLPTDQDIKLGVYTRYFCKKNNELKYMEIDKNTFQQLSTRSNNIAWDLYTPISTLWYTNKDANSYKANKGLISLIEKNQNWYGFTQWFKDKF